MTRKKASKLRFGWIAFMTGIYTLWYCFKVISGSFFIKNFRPFVDQMMLNWSQKLLGLLRVTVSVKGLDNFPAQCGRPLIVMCNHSSLYDIPVSAVALSTTLRMLTKRELFKIPVFGTALSKGEYISIDRHNREQALKDLDRAKQKMLSGVVLWVAPEGTRSKDGQLGEFKRGGFHIALESGALIIPLVIKNIYKVQAGNNLDLYLGQTVEVEVCQPVDAADYKVEDRKALVSKIHGVMETKLADPSVNSHSSKRGDK